MGSVATEINVPSVFNRLGNGHHQSTKIKTCKFWLQGRCNRIPCVFLHTMPLAPKTKQQLVSNQWKPSKDVDTIKNQLIVSNQLKPSKDVDTIKKQQLVSNQLKPSKDVDTIKNQQLVSNQLKPSKDIDTIKNQQLVSNQLKPSKDVDTIKKQQLVSNQLKPSKDVDTIKNQQLVSNQLKPSKDVDTIKKLSRSRRRMILKNKKDPKKPVNSHNGDQKQEMTPVDVSHNGDRGEESEFRGVKRVKCDLIEPTIDETHEGSSAQPSQSASGSGLTCVRKVQGSPINGISVTPRSTNLWIATKDKYVASWDCYTGENVNVSINEEAGCIIRKGQMLFVGLQNSIKAWNFRDKKEFSLNVSGGRVHSLEFVIGNLFAGMEDGGIVVWTVNSETRLELFGTVKGHTGPVKSLVVRRSGDANRLYSASDDDCSIKVWDQHYECIQTLHGHTRGVTSLLLWDKWLLSASLDKTLKVWRETESGTMEMVIEHKVDHAIMSMGRIIYCPRDQETLICALEDKSVRIFDHSFVEKGRIFTKGHSPVIQVGVDRHLFIGDDAGELSIWKVTSWSSFHRYSYDSFLKLSLLRPFDSRG